MNTIYFTETGVLLGSTRQNDRSGFNMRVFIVVASAVCVAFALPAALFGGNSRAREAALRRSAVERTANMEEYVPVDHEAESRRLQKERRELEYGNV